MNFWNQQETYIIPVESRKKYEKNANELYEEMLKLPEIK